MLEKTWKGKIQWLYSAGLASQINRKCLNQGCDLMKNIHCLHVVQTSNPSGVACLLKSEVNNVHCQSARFSLAHFETFVEEKKISNNNNSITYLCVSNK